MEGRVRVASNHLTSVGQERPLWKVMMRLVQALGHDVPVINLEELRQQVVRFLPDLGKAWDADEVDSFLMPTARNSKAAYVPAKAEDVANELDVVSRYSLYREGIWARASALLTHAGELHALDDVLVHPDTLKALGLEPGELVVVSELGEQAYTIATRCDVSPGVLFVAKRGVAGDLSNSVRVSLRGGAA
jgi:NADH-quinone oxidoreductase subunit G